LAVSSVLNLGLEIYLYLDYDCDAGGGDVAEARRRIFFDVDVRPRMRIRRLSRIHRRIELFGEEVVPRVVGGTVGFEVGSIGEAGQVVRVYGEVYVDMVVLEDCMVAFADDNSACSLRG